MRQTSTAGEHGLLTTPDIRELLRRLSVRPTKVLGQNFVTDPGTIRRIVRAAEVTEDDHVLEIGPGLGSLTLGLLETGAQVTAVEIDGVLADALGATVAARQPERAHRLSIQHADAMALTGAVGSPVSLVANLPYNVAVPVLLHAWATLPSLRTALVMVQSEVADRIAAPPGSRTYGVPSAKVAWYASARRAGAVARQVFWPTPNVDSALVRLDRRDAPATSASRVEVFAVIDAAFSQRRKTLRSALAAWAGSPDAAADAVRAAGVDPGQRGERLGIEQFAAIAEHKPSGADEAGSRGGDS